jgi:hypothetical protein
MPAGTRAGALALGIALLAACGAALAQATAAPVHELRLVDGALPAGERALVVHKGDALRWRISSNTPGELHLHAYRLVATVKPGQPAELDFTAHATGRFRLEWHAAGAASAAPGGHHGPPLATLDVRPR